MEIDNRASSSHSAESHSNNAISFGHRLKQARVSQGLSTDDVAKKLFILRRHIEAIEAEDFKELPQIAFARGFVVNYAKLVKLDPDQIVDSFNRAYPEELKQESVQNIKSPLKPMGTLQREGGRSWKINPLLILGVIGLIILAVFILRTVASAQDTTEPDQDETTLVDDLTDSEQLAGAAVGVPSDAPIPNADAEVSNTGSAVGLTTDDTASTSDSKLDFWVTGDVTLRVTDATGTSLISGQQSRGGYSLTGKPPFKILIEDVSKVSLNMDNQPIKLNEFAEDNKADFTLSP